MTETVVSKNGVPIRLTDERWVHISEEHAELAGYRLEVLEAIHEAERIVAGNAGELPRASNIGEWQIACRRVS